jgi:tRNA threonylcarbamoyladenosine biosynthesis protein TsaE
LLHIWINGSKMPAKMKDRIETHSRDETEAAGAQFAASLQGHENLAFFGDLGAGKTTFLKGLISTLTGCSPDEITSPTFNYLNIYEGKFPVYHFDLYRLTAAEQFEGAGFSEYLKADGVCCLEWAEKIENQLPPGTIRITLQHQGKDCRLITIDV